MKEVPKLGITLHRTTWRQALRALKAVVGASQRYKEMHQLTFVTVSLFGILHGAALIASAAAVFILELNRVCFVVLHEPDLAYFNSKMFDM